MTQHYRRIDVGPTTCADCGEPLGGTVIWPDEAPDPFVSFPHWRDAEGACRHRMEVTPDGRGPGGPARRPDRLD